MRHCVALITSDHSPSWTYIFGLTFSCQAARARVTVAMTHQQNSNPGCILGAMRRLARLIFSSRWCRSGARNDDVVPGFAVSSAGTGNHRERPHARTKKKGNEIRRGSRTRTVYVSPSHCAPRAMEHLSAERRQRPRRRGALSRVRGDETRALLSLVANTHYAGRCADAAAAVTCDATTSFPVAVVASTVVHRRPAARMSYRGRSAAPQRPSGTFTLSRHARRRTAWWTREEKKKDQQSLTSRHSRSRVQASTRERRFERPVRPLRTGRQLQSRTYQPSAPTDARRHTDVATGDARSPPSRALPTERCAPHQAARASLRRAAPHYRGRKREPSRNALSLPLPLFLTLCPGTASVCVITRDRRRRTRDVHARGYSGKTPRTVRL